MSLIYEEFVNEFVANYLKTAEEIDKPEHVPRRLEFSDRAKSEARAACIMFLAKASKIVPGEWVYQLKGGDFWLSRNGHGDGFFCRGDEEFLGELQDLAESYPARGLFVNREFEWEFVPR